MKKQKKCRFHRFQDVVAFDLDDTETLYVSEQLARKMAAQLIVIADSIATESFGESEVGMPIVEDSKVENLQVTYEPGSDSDIGSFTVRADTPKGPYVLDRELPMELMSEDGLDWEETLNGEEVEEGPDFDPPFTEGTGADLFAERAEELVRKKLEAWL